MARHVEVEPYAPERVEGEEFVHGAYGACYLAYMTENEISHARIEVDCDGFKVVECAASR